MNEEKIERILNKIGRTDVPSNATLIAERASRNFDVALKIAQPKQWFFTPLRLIAAAAVVVLAFYMGLSVGRRTEAASSPAIVVAGKTYNENYASFWQQKAIAKMQYRPTAQTDISYTEKLNAYKQYLKE